MNEYSIKNNKSELPDAPAWLTLVERGGLAGEFRQAVEEHGPVRIVQKAMEIAELLGSYLSDQLAPQLAPQAKIPIIYPIDGGILTAEGIRRRLEATTSLTPTVFPSIIESGKGRSHSIPQEALEMAREANAIIFADGVVATGMSFRKMADCLKPSFPGLVKLAANYTYPVILRVQYQASLIDPIQRHAPNLEFVTGEVRYGESPNRDRLELAACLAQAAHKDEGLKLLAEGLKKQKYRDLLPK